MDDKIIAIIAIAAMCCFGTWMIESDGVAIITGGVAAIAGLAGYTAAKGG